jgi:hypothetical protein
VGDQRHVQAGLRLAAERRSVEHFQRHAENVYDRRRPVDFSELLGKIPLLVATFQEASIPLGQIGCGFICSLQKIE